MIAKQLRLQFSHHGEFNTYLPCHSCIYNLDLTSQTFSLTEGLLCMGTAYINIQLSRQEKLPSESPLPHPPRYCNSITQDKEIPQSVKPISQKGGKRNHISEKYFHFLRLTMHVFYHLSTPSTCGTEFQLQSIQRNSNLPWLCQISAFKNHLKI